MRIIGSYLSPYVRKVLACLELKGLAYEIDPIVPFLGDDRFTQLSPLRRPRLAPPRPPSKRAHRVAVWRDGPGLAQRPLL